MQCFTGYCRSSLFEMIPQRSAASSWVYSYFCFLFNVKAPEPNSRFLGVNCVQNTGVALV